MRPGPGSQLLDPPAEGQEVHPGWRSQAAAPHHGLSQVRALPAVCFSALTHQPCGPTWGMAAEKPRRALLAHFLPVFLHTLVQVSGVSGLALELRGRSRHVRLCSLSTWLRAQSGRLNGVSLARPADRCAPFRQVGSETLLLLWAGRLASGSISSWPGVESLSPDLEAHSVT